MGRAMLKVLAGPTPTALFPCMLRSTLTLLVETDMASLLLHHTTNCNCSSYLNLELGLGLRSRWDLADSR